MGTKRTLPPQHDMVSMVFRMLAVDDTTMKQADSALRACCLALLPHMITCALEADLLDRLCAGALAVAAEALVATLALVFLVAKTQALDTLTQLQVLVDAMV